MPWWVWWDWGISPPHPYETVTLNRSHLIKTFWQTHVGEEIEATTTTKPTSLMSCRPFFLAARLPVATA